jgi:hypothetical protein
MKSRKNGPSVVVGFDTEIWNLLSLHSHGHKWRMIDSYRFLSIACPSKIFGRSLQLLDRIEFVASWNRTDGDLVWQDISVFVFEFTVDIIEFSERQTWFWKCFKCFKCSTSVSERLRRTERLKRRVMPEILYNNKTTGKSVAKRVLLKTTLCIYLKPLKYE